MKKWLLYIPFLATISCAGNFHDTLGKVQDAAIAARMTFQPVIDGMCRDLAIQCRNEKSAENNHDEVMFTNDLSDKVACDRFEVCDGIRMYVISVFEHIQMLIADANMSYALGDSESAEEAIAKALELIQQIREQMRALGYME